MRIPNSRGSYTSEHGQEQGSDHKRSRGFHLEPALRRRFRRREIVLATKRAFTITSCRVAGSSASEPRPRTLLTLDSPVRGTLLATVASRRRPASGGIHSAPVPESAVQPRHVPQA